MKVLLDEVVMIGRIINYSILFVVFGCCIFGCYHVINARFGLEHDNIFEENLEDIIEHQLGISIDLTPENPDPNSD